jgi:hypothetical protein
MRGLPFGVSALALSVSLCLGCGKTGRVPAGQGGSGGTAEVGVSGEAGADQIEQGGSVATGGVGASGGTDGNMAGMGGMRMLPPDGVVAPAVPLHKLDLLLMIDNSIGTASKQQLLSDAVDWLLTGAKLSADDIHVGVVTSSLGSHGANGAHDVCVTPDDNDHAQLIGALRPGLTTYKNSGFLAWGPTADPKIETVAAELDAMIRAVGQEGCGYEASLEAWYRFLVDPAPPEAIVLPMGQSTAQPQGIDATLLAQRAAFLRPDSVLSIVMLTDENDCSIQDDGYGWLISRAAPMFRATSQCSNPNDKCCQSCGEQTANPGCPALSSDVECSKGQTLTGQGADDLNLRCFNQHGRFGFDLLYPISRYTDGLTRQTAWGRNGEPVANPIFAGQMRHPSQVIFTGIVGVPWQDLADKASLTGAGLTYMTAAELTKAGRWKTIVGDASASPPVRPEDPFMIEATYDRAMLSSVHANPITGDALTPSASTNPHANAINGHESVDLGSELQAACSFTLPVPLDCASDPNTPILGCRCSADAAAAFNRAVCQPPAGGPAGTTQYGDIAYPGIRHLQLLQSLGSNAVTASACPKVTTLGQADFGYRPAMKALAARLEAAFNP